MTENETTTEKRTAEVEIERDVITVKTDLDVPEKYPALPIFAGQGWLYADTIKQLEMSKVLRITDDDTGARLKFNNSWERSESLPAGQYARARKADLSFEVGDFIIDTRSLRDGSPQMRVRIHPRLTDPDPKVVVEKLGEGEN